MQATVFECGNEKCSYAIDSYTLTKIQLKALRLWKKTCPRCHEQTQWQEKLQLLDTKTLQVKINGGSDNAKATKKSKPKNNSKDGLSYRRGGLH